MCYAILYRRQQWTFYHLVTEFMIYIGMNCQLMSEFLFSWWFNGHKSHLNWKDWAFLCAHLRHFWRYTIWLLSFYVESLEIAHHVWFVDWARSSWHWNADSQQKSFFIFLRWFAALYRTIWYFDNCRGTKTLRLFHEFLHEPQQVLRITNESKS